MKKVKITVMRKVRHDDLIDKYENPLEHECDVEEGDVFIANGWEKPEEKFRQNLLNDERFILTRCTQKWHNSFVKLIS